MSTPREAFCAEAVRLVEERSSIALVYAEISRQYFDEVGSRHPLRAINVGIREQLLVNVGAGLALTGLRPIVHTFGAFLVERAFEQVKLGFSHQDVGGVLVGSGGSFDMSDGGRTHQAPGDVPLMDTLPSWTIHVPGTAAEVEGAVRLAASGSGRDYVRVVAQQNDVSYRVQPGRFHVVRRGGRTVVLAVGPTLSPVLAATCDLDVTVLYANVVRPFDHRTLRAMAGDEPHVVLVEPYLAGTSARLVAETFADVPHRLLSLGVGRRDLRRYGSPEAHVAAHGLDAVSLRHAVIAFQQPGDGTPCGHTGLETSSSLRAPVTA